MATEASEPIERWTAKRRVALVVSILKGETSVAEAARTHGLTVAEVEDWREKFLLRAENALRALLHLVSERQYRIEHCDIELSVRI